MDYLTNALGPLVSLPLLGLLCILLAAFLTFDKLVRLEYQEHYEKWTQDGKPDGFFWHPKESTWFKSSLARYRLDFYWLFVTPEWVKQSSQAKKLLWQWRICTVIWNLGIIGPLVIVILLTVR